MLHRPIETAPVIGMWLFAPQSFRLEIALEAQWTSEVKLWQTCYEIGEKSSKIVPLGAPPHWGVIGRNLKNDLRY